MRQIDARTTETDYLAIPTRCHDDDTRTHLLDWLSIRCTHLGTVYDSLNKIANGSALTLLLLPNGAHWVSLFFSFALYFFSFCFSPSLSLSLLLSFYCTLISVRLIENLFVSPFARIAVSLAMISSFQNTALCLRMLRIKKYQVVSSVDLILLFLFRSSALSWYTSITLS